MKIILLIIISGFASVDRNAALNIMLSRPVVLSTIIGLLFGNVEMCFMVGVLFELIGLVDVPVGTHVPRDDTFAVYALSLLIGFDQITSVSDILFSLLLIIIFIYPVTFSEKLIRKFNQMLYLKQKKLGILSDKLESLLLRGIVISFMRGVIVYNICFLLIAFLLTQLNDYVIINGDHKKYLYFSIIFLSGFLLRFLSFKSIFKYIVFLTGIFIGWLI